MEARPLGQPHQPLARPVDELGVGREHDVLRLHGGVGPRTDPGITWRVSAGFIAPVLTARLSLACNSATIRSSPMRLRQRVIDERSNGRSWRKNSSPHKYWKYEFSIQRAHSASSDRLKVCLRIWSPAIIKASAEKIPVLQSRAARVVCPSPGSRFTAMKAVNHATPGGEIANWNCKKTIHKLAFTCNSEA